MKFNKCTTDCLRLKTTSEGFSQCFGSMKMTEFDLKELNLLITLLRNTALLHTMFPDRFLIYLPLSSKFS